MSLVDKKHNVKIVEALAIVSMVDKKHNVKIVEALALVSLVDKNHNVNYVHIAVITREQWTVPLELSRTFMIEVLCGKIWDLRHQF